ncbi:FAD-dependent oxidoreductase [Salinisphaera sp.]|uniref:NAD(P)/FAD-dependent oxidoreductase n=1 Tax=Salinisphaera sp. TaxID=1914330 RepID=UPI0025D3B104|nr:FAD-dependent oxidoreductase [Salinisphaera sp.]
MSTQAKVVLVGAGHAHLHVAAHADALAEAGASVTLVDPGTFWYSGRATGMLGGRFAPEDDQIDPRAVVENHGGAFVAGHVETVDRERQRLHLADGQTLAYDWLSFNVGSGVNSSAIDGCTAEANCWPVKPIANLAPLRTTLSRAFAAGEAPAVAVVGGGNTGCEIAANIAALARRHAPTDARPAIRLLQGGDTFAPSLPASAGKRLADKLAALGIDVQYNRRITERRDGELICDDGEHIAAAHVVIATGLVAPQWLAHLGLAFDDGLVVDDTLRSVDDPQVFAVGDCAHIRGHALARLGVFGVRQAPVLLANLLAGLRGQALENYEPQSKWLSILDLGDGTGLASRGQRWWLGRSSVWLKHWLDRRFIESYRPR